MATGDLLVKITDMAGAPIGTRVEVDEADSGQCRSWRRENGSCRQHG